MGLKFFYAKAWRGVFANAVKQSRNDMVLPWIASRCSQGRKYSKLKTNPGFTLIEMIVSIALFSVVMMVAVGALLSLTGANKKAQALQSVMNNLNISVDSMVRNIRMGRNYHCGAGNFVGDGSDDCATGDTQILFTCNPDTPSCAKTKHRWGYKLGTGAPNSPCSAGHLCKSIDAEKVAPTWAEITADEVTIEDVTFYVVGTAPGESGNDMVQPKVIMVIKGEAGTGKAKTTFHIQATAVQRELDL